MSLGIKEIRPSLPEEWDSVWRRCPYATYFHSREWAEIWSRYKQGKLRPNPFTVVFTDGKEAMLPLSCILVEGSVWSFVSPPDGTYGGWIAADPIGREHAILMKEFLTKELGRLYWYINPYDDLVSAIPVDTIHLEETHAVQLREGFDAVYGNWSPACRRAERKARKSGVRIKCADTEGEWREYYHAYEDSLRRWGDQALSRYDWALFREMFDRHSGDIKLWLATTGDGSVAAGALVFYANTHSVYWHGATLEEHFAQRPMNLLFFEILRDACDKGYRWFDFGQSGGREGVRQFKESFGATPLGCSYVYVNPTVATTVTEIR